MEKMVHPHNNVITAAFNDMRVARDFFEVYLKADIKKLIDLSTLKIQNGSFIDKNLNPNRTDILYRAQYRQTNDPIYLYLLMEAQSTPDKLMPFRLLQYICRIIEQHQVQYPKDKYLPLVVPIVFYTGKRPYKYSMNIEDLFREPRDQVKPLLFGPYPRIDLHDLPDDELFKHPWVGFVEMALKHAKTRDNILFVLEEMTERFIKPILREQHTEKYIESVIKYIINQADILNTDAFSDVIHKHLPAEMGEKIMTMAEYWQQQGLQQGLQQGVKMVALRMYQVGLAEDMILQATGLTEEALNELVQKEQETCH